MTDVLTLPGGAAVFLPQVMTLGETQPGDVFYLASDPQSTWLRDDGKMYNFMQLGWDTWRELEDIGDGDPGQQVIVVHNVRKPLR